MPWNFQIFRGNAPGENVGAVPKAQLRLSTELSKTPVFIGFSDAMSGVQKFRIFGAELGLGVPRRDVNLIHPRHKGSGVWEPADAARAWGAGGKGD
jgi:hypothetical protein